MPVKIKGTKALKRNMKKFLPDARSNFAKDMKARIVDIIVEKITSGYSPVKGQNKYKQYASSTAKEKGRKAPVDLVDSGEMLEDMRARQTAQDDVIVEFRTAKQNRKASYHQFGTDSLPERKILPQGREIFKVGIMNKILDALDKAVKAALK